jgi:hypothetical protein
MKIYLFAGIWTISLMIPYWFLYKDLALISVLFGTGCLLITSYFRIREGL